MPALWYGRCSDQRERLRQAEPPRSLTYNRNKPRASMTSPPKYDLDRILNPHRLVVIGASRDPVKRGYRAIQSLLEDRYQGEIVPINPREREILGLACYPSLAEAPGEIDLAIVCTAAKTVPGVIEECGRRGVKGAVLLAAGFSEAGEDGRRLEEETVAVARRYGIRLIGPNTNGLFSARLGCNAWGLPDIPRGPLGLVSNSANVVTSVVLQARFHGHMGINTLLSVGNQADILFHEYVECLGSAPDVSAIMLYLEGFKDAPAFTAAARRTTASKPVVMYVAGRTGEGKRAAKSHSGSLAGAYAVNRGALRQAGVTLVERFYHLYPVAEALSVFPRMPGRRVAVLSEGGGPITVAADALVEQGLVLAQLSEATQARIHAGVRNATAISNPVDAGGGTDPRSEYYGPIVEALLEDPSIDALLIVGLLGGYAERFGPAQKAPELAVCEAIGAMAKRYGKPVIVQSHYAEVKTPALDVLRAAGVPYQRHVEVAVQCLASAAEWSEARARFAGEVPEAPPVPVAAASRLVDAALAEGRDLLEPEAREVLAAYGIAVPRHLVVRDEAGAASAASAFGDARLAMKVVSADILHKSEAKGVRLDLAGAEALARGLREIEAAARAYRPGARLAGALVTPMAPRGTEVIVGVTRDPHYGPVLLFGLGGVFVEAIEDVVFRTLPVTMADAREMIASLRYARVLDGLRGAEPADREALADLLVRVSRLAAAEPRIAEIDLNPVIVHARGYTIVDARMVCASRGS